MDKPINHTENHSLAAFVLTNVFPVIYRIFHHLNFKSLSNASQVCRLWHSLTAKEWTKRMPFALRMIDPEEGCLEDASSKRFDNFIGGLMMRPDVILRAVITEESREHLLAKDDLVISKSIPNKTSFFNIGNTGVIGQITKNSPSVEYEFLEDDGHSFLAFQYTEKFQFAVLKSEMKVRDVKNVDLNTLCDKKIDGFVDPLILLFVFGDKRALLITERFIKIANKAFSQTFSIIGGVTGNIETKINGEDSQNDKLAGIILDGKNISYEMLVHESDNRDILLSGLKDIKSKMSKKMNSEDLRHCFMLMVTCCGRGQYFYGGDKNVECDIVNKVFPGLPVFGFFSNGEIACIKGKTQRPILSYTSVFCLVNFKDSIWK